MTFIQTFTSSIGKKLVMGITGLSLIAFITVHVSINACIFAADGGVMFNKAAHFMGSTVLIRIAEVGLFLGLLLHIIQGLVLSYQNLQARKTKYIVNNPSSNSTWYSRSMGILGSILLFFLAGVYFFSDSRSQNTGNRLLSFTITLYVPAGKPG